MALKILARRDDLYVWLNPGDTFRLQYNDKTVLVQEIDKHILATSAVVFEIDGELGLEVGIGGAFGKRSEQ